MNTDALEEELARVRPELEKATAVRAQLCHATKMLEDTGDELALTSEALVRAEFAGVEHRRDLEACLSKMRLLENQHADRMLLEKEASFLRYS